MPNPVLTPAIFGDGLAISGVLTSAEWQLRVLEVTEIDLLQQCVESLKTNQKQYIPSYESWDHLGEYSQICRLRKLLRDSDSRFPEYVCFVQFPKLQNLPIFTCSAISLRVSSKDSEPHHHHHVTQLSRVC